MKKIIFFAAMIWAVMGYAQTWTVVPTGITTNFNAICKTPDSTIFVVGDDGVILKKENNGTWQTISSVTTNDLRSVSFPSDSVGYTVVSVLGGGTSSSLGVLFSTNNSGGTFNNSTITTEYINDIFFVNDSIGWVAGKNGLIMKTTNRGVNWTAQTTVNNAFEFRSIFFINDSVGWACGDGGVVRKTTNGGLNWTNQSLQSNLTNGTELNAVFFISPTHGWMADDRNIHYTTDGGNTWVAVVISATVQDVYFTSNTQGWAVGLGGTRFYTSDGGLSWTLHSQGGDPLYSVTFISPNKGWAVGHNGKLLEFSTPSTIHATNTDFSFTLNPNPSSFSSYIKFPKIDNYTVNICDVNGRLMKVIKVDSNDSVEIITSDLNIGLYNVLITDSNGSVSVRKLIKQ
jgi:photosystem II stability/assembly factor-like uncharacterized protein